MLFVSNWRTVQNRYEPRFIWSFFGYQLEGGRWEDIRLFTRRCLFVFVGGNVTGGWDVRSMGEQRVAVVGDQRSGSDMSFPGVIGNSKRSDAGIVWEKVG